MRRDRRRRLAVLLVPLVVAAAVGWWVVGRDGGGILPDEEFVSSYRLVYSVTESGTGERSEERLVQRPYWSRVVSERGGTVLTGTITNDAGRWLFLSEAEGWQLRDERKQRPPDDVRAIEALEAAAEDGRAMRRGTDVVAGRTCTIVRTGGPLGDPLKKPTADEHADLCVDRTGVVLREEWRLDGRVARLMVATTFEPGVSLDAGDFRPSPEPAPRSDDTPGVIEVRTLVPSDAPPVEVRGVDGYRADGPVVAVERNVGGFGIEVTYSQSFVVGDRLVVAEQGETPGQFVPRGARVDLGNGVTGHLDLGLNASALLILVGDGDYVRLRGAELDVLEAFGRDVARRLD